MNSQEPIPENTAILELLNNIQQLRKKLSADLMNTYNRDLPLNELLSDRWKRARNLGFGEKTSIYDSSLVFAPIEVGTNCWIGPFTILDGSGTLKIGDHCTISSGVHIYTHDNVKQTLSGGQLPIERSPVTIGNNVYIGPNSVIAKGITIGNHVVIATGSFVNRDIPNNRIVAGTPAKIIGEVKMNGDEISFEYQ